MSGHRPWREIRAERKESAEWERLHKVVRKMPVSGLLDHLDAAGTGIARATQNYRQDEEAFWLAEMERGLNELLAVVEELKLRNEAANDEH